MGWLGDTFKKLTDPFDVMGDDVWNMLHDPAGVFGVGGESDDADPLGIDPNAPVPKPVSMSRAKAQQDIALRKRFGIGGSRARSRVVSPFGSGPADRSYERTRSVSPVSDMSVATSPESEIDIINFNLYVNRKTITPTRGSTEGLTPEINPLIGRMILPESRDLFLKNEIKRERTSGQASNTIFWK